MREEDRAKMISVERELVKYKQAKEILNKLSGGGIQSLFYLPDLVEVKTVYVKVDFSDGKRNYHLNKSGQYEQVSRNQLIDFMSMGEVFL